MVSYLLVGGHRNRLIKGAMLYAPNFIKYTDTHVDICFLKVLFIFRERGREGEREEGKYQCLRKTLIGSLLHAPRLTGNWETTFHFAGG